MTVREKCLCSSRVNKLFLSAAVPESAGSLACHPADSDTAADQAEQLGKTSHIRRSTLITRGHLALGLLLVRLRTGRWRVPTDGVLASASVGEGERYLTSSWAFWETDLTAAIIDLWLPAACWTLEARPSFVFGTSRMNSLDEASYFVAKLADRVAAMDWLVFVIASLSAAIGYIAAVIIHHRQISAQREGNRLLLQMERKELNSFMSHVQSVASDVDEKVDRHSSSLSTINYDLNKTKQPDPKVVLHAVKKLYEANLQLHGELSSAQEQIDLKQQQLESYMTEARTDKLTGISNRRAFDEEMYRLFSLSKRRRGQLCLMLADIDHFKMFNDYHGHQVGDEMLRRVADTFERTTRTSDIVCRYGGEEFAILLPRTKLADALQVAERIRDAVQSVRYQIGDAQLHVTVSIGVVEIRSDEDISGFIKRGDDALYAAKLAGRNCVRDEPSRASQQLDKVMATVVASNAKTTTACL